MNQNPYRNLPAVHEVLQAPLLVGLKEKCSHDALVDGVRTELADLRRLFASGDGVVVEGEATVARIAERVVARLNQDLRPRFREVINATGIVLHTNLGRAPMAESAARAAFDAARGYLNLEMDLTTGKRSSRQAAVREWICRLTGAESATVVNNNAAATIIVLRALCQGREVIVSRGQLIEIGGSFRIPEIMATSGAVLREVGTTNITRAADYERAIGPNTAALMQIHTSNYRISGFTKSASTAELVAIGTKHGIKVIDDIGSGALVDLSLKDLRKEPVASDSIATGVDVALFSGDKLLGGPQAGIIAGRAEWITRIERDPLMRALRLDKMSLAALEATLRLYLTGETCWRDIPTLRMLGTTDAELRDRATALAERLRAIRGVTRAEVAEDVTFAGGGSLPDQPLKTFVVEVSAESSTEAELAYRLRTGEPAVVARIHDGKLLVDPRTILPGQEDILIGAVEKAVGSGRAGF